jgi:hypothetical protein
MYMARWPAVDGKIDALSALTTYFLNGCRLPMITLTEIAGLDPEHDFIRLARSH